MDAKELQKKLQKELKKRLDPKTVGKLLGLAPPVVLANLFFEAVLPQAVKGEKKRLRGVKYTMQFHVTGLPFGGWWWLDIDDGFCKIHRGRLDFPHYVINVDAADIPELVGGNLDPAGIVLSGKIGVSGTLDRMRLLQALR